MRYNGNGLKIVLMSLDKQSRLIAKPRSYRVQECGVIDTWHRNLRIGTRAGWVDIRRLPRTQTVEDIPVEFTAAVNMFHRYLRWERHNAPHK